MVGREGGEGAGVLISKNEYTGSFFSFFPKRFSIRGEFDD